MLLHHKLPPLQSLTFYQAFPEVVCDQGADWGRGEALDDPCHRRLPQRYVWAVINKNSCSDSRMEVKLPDLLGNYDRPTDQPTDQPTNRRT